MDDKIWVVYSCDSWRFSPELTSRSARRSVFNLFDIEKTIKNTNNGRCDICDWLNFGLFIDRVIAGSDEKLSNIQIYGIYRDEEESKKEFENFSLKFISESIANKQ